jgi:hypothetical protein
MIKDRKFNDALLCPRSLAGARLLVTSPNKDMSTDRVKTLVTIGVVAVLAFQFAQRY